MVCARRGRIPAASGSHIRVSGIVSALALYRSLCFHPRSGSSPPACPSGLWNSPPSSTPWACIELRNNRPQVYASWRSCLRTLWMCSTRCATPIVSGSWYARFSRRTCHSNMPRLNTMRQTGISSCSTVGFCSSPRFPMHLYSVNQQPSHVPFVTHA